MAITPMKAAQVISILVDERPGDLLLAWEDLGGGWIKRAKSGLNEIYHSGWTLTKKPENSTFVYPAEEYGRSLSKADIP